MHTLMRTDLFAGPSILTGNTGKVRVLHDVAALITADPAIRVLDVGCVGGDFEEPLSLWHPLLRAHPSFGFTGVDVQGIERAEAAVRSHGWEGRVSLHRGSGYELARLFPAESFDVLMALQVLEHVAAIERFMTQVSALLRPGGHAFFTIDSAHWRSRYDRREPVRLVKNGIKKGLSMLGREHRFNYDLPWYDHEVAAAGRAVGLEVVGTRYYGLPAVKRLHNNLVPPEQRNAMMRLWYALEELVNDDPVTRERARQLFGILYVHLRKPE